MFHHLKCSSFEEYDNKRLDIIEDLTYLIKKRQTLEIENDEKFELKCQILKDMLAADNIDASGTSFYLTSLDKANPLSLSQYILEVSVYRLCKVPAIKMTS